MIIEITHDADLAIFAAASNDCAPFEYDLMVDGLDAEIREVQLPGSNGIAPGAVFLDGEATAAAIEEIEALEWVEGVSI